MSLSVRNLSQYHGKKHIVQSVSFDAPAQSIIALLGPNGAGKTTLLRTVIGLNKIPSSRNANENKIILNERDVSTWSVAQRVQAGLIYVPQSPSLFLDLSVEDNLNLVFDYSAYWLAQKKRGSRATFNQECDVLLKKANLQETLPLKAGALSGGQKRKLEIVRALLLHPTNLIFDEPFAGVDPKSIYELKELFRELAHNGMTIIISDHHVDQLLSIAHKVYVIVAGKVVVSGSVKEIMEHEYTKTMYLGPEFHSEMLNRFVK